MTELTELNQNNTPLINQPAENSPIIQWIKDKGMALITIYNSKKPEVSLLPLLSFIAQIPSGLDDRSASSTFIQGLLCTLPVRLLSLFQKRENNQSWEKALETTLIEGLRDFVTLAALYGIKEATNMPGIFGSEMSANVINDFIPEDLQVRFEEESYDYYMVLAWALALSANILRNGVERYQEKNINHQSVKISEIALPSIIQGSIETIASWGINLLWHELVASFPSYRPREYHKLKNSELHPSNYQKANGVSVASCQEPDSLPRNYYSGHTSTSFTAATPVVDLALTVNKTINKKPEVKENLLDNNNNDEEKQQTSSELSNSKNNHSYYNDIVNVASWGFAVFSSGAALGTGLLRVISTCHSTAAVTQGALQGGVASYLGKEVTKMAYSMGNSFFSKGNTDESRSHIEMSSLEEKNNYIATT